MQSAHPSHRLLEFLARDTPVVQLDIENQCLWKGDRATTLTPKSFLVLEYLSSHAREVVLHDHLAKYLWPDTFVESNNLKKYIREVRRALGDDPTQPRFIETLPRRGYRFLPAVRRVGPAAATPSAHDAKRSMMVGRERHLKSLSECMSKAEAGERQIVFLHGEPGVGKTALVEEFLKSIGTNHPFRYGVAHCLKVASAGEAYSPFLGLLEELCDADVTGATTRLVQEYAPVLSAHLSAPRATPKVLDLYPDSPHRLAREIFRIIELLAGAEPLLLVLEDIQWADPASLDIISILANRATTSHLMLVATCQVSLVEKKEAPIKTMMKHLASHSLCVCVAVGRLERNEVAAYLKEVVAGDEPHPQLSDTIYALSSGNPFIMQAMLEECKGKGICLCSKNDGAISMMQDGDIPAKVRDFVGLQLAALSIPDRELLEAASVVGDLFSTNEIAVALGADPVFVEERMLLHLRVGHFFKAAGRFGEDDPQTYEFSVPAVRTVVYERIPATRKKQIHDLLAKRLEANWGEQPVCTDPPLTAGIDATKKWPHAAPYLLAASNRSCAT